MVVAAGIVWLTERRWIPLSARSVTLTLTPSDKLVARVSQRRELKLLILAVERLNPDEHVGAIYNCPALLGTQAPTELRMTFAATAGRTVAVLETEWCPPDASLSVPGYKALQLIAGSPFIDELEAITGLTLPVRST